MIDWLAAAGLGLLLGVLTGMSVGVISAAVAQAAIANRVRFGIGIGVGGAVADAIHASAAFAGVRHLDATWTSALSIVAAVVILGFVALAWRTRRMPVAVEDHSSFTRGLPAGLLLTLPNPAALGAWITVAALLWRQPHPIVVGISVGLGSAVWFAIFARFVAKRRDHRFVRALPKIALAILVAFAVTTAVRAGYS
jgi:threonine/homoserine/homoserine lactone efflux protein